MSLDLTYDELRQQVGFHLGFGMSGWNTNAVATIDLSIRNGLRRFLFSSLVPQTRKRWEWSFLRKSWLFSTVTGKSTYLLPEDFGVYEGPIHFVSDQRTTIPIVGEGMLRAKEAEEATGVPSWAAIVPVPDPSISPQRQTLLFYPEPDGAYDLRLLYQVNPDMLSAELTSPHGGAPHARTILLTILLESAVRVDSSRDFEREHAEALAASIDFDAKMKGDNWGYNGDPSSYRDMVYRTTNFTAVTMDGVTYDGV